MRVIELTRGYVTIVDDDDFLELAQYRWRANGAEWCYACRWSPMVNHARHLILMHVAILKPPPGYDVDHRNGNTLDNRKENLRLATPHQNGANRRVAINNKYGLKGVSFHKARGRFQARIKKHGKHHWLGLFNTPEEAQEAYNKAASILYGDFAKLIAPSRSTDHVP